MNQLLSPGDKVTLVPELNDDREWTVIARLYVFYGVVLEVVEVDDYPVEGRPRFKDGDVGFQSDDGEWYEGYIYVIDTGSGWGTFTEEEVILTEKQPSLFEEE